VRWGIDPVIDRSRTLALLGEHKPVLAERFGVTRLALFGSVARGTALPGSDIDLLVEFDGPTTPYRYFGVQFHLEDLLGREVDLLTERALRQQPRPNVARDAITIA
jgi:predicted nucleotidyltransferase